MPRMLLRAAARAGAVLAVSAVATAAGDARATTFSQCDFSSASALVLNGSAAQSGSLLQLTTAARDQAGTAFYGTAVPWSASTSFHTSFQVQMVPGASGSEGIAFVLQASGADAVGGDSYDIGYGGIAPSLEIELDTYADTFDPDGNHVAVMSGGVPQTHLAYADPGFAMSGGGVLYGWIDYDAASTELDVYLSQASSKPGTALLTTDVVLPNATSFFVGFSSATGSATLSEQDVLAWELSTDGVPCACDGDTACGGATPVCAPASSSQAGLCTAAVAIDAGAPMPEAGPPDGSAEEAGLDAGQPEAGHPDASSGVDHDAGAVHDAGVHADASLPPASSAVPAKEAGHVGGGACAFAPPDRTSFGGSALAGLLGVVSMVWRRRRGSRRG